MRVIIGSASAGDRLGCATALHGDWVMVSACNAENNHVAGAGVVHTFRLSSRLPGGIVVPPIPQLNAYFGTALAMGEQNNAGLLLVGSIGEEIRQGCVYVFQFALDAQLLAFGTSVPIGMDSGHPSCRPCST